MRELPLAAIHQGSAWALVLTSLAIMGSPGPATLSLTAAGGAHGVRRSIPYLSGIVAGTEVVLLAVATGITAALLAVPALRSVLIAASAAYLLWLAYRVATAPAPHAANSATRAPSLAGGLLLGISNPKAWVAIAAVYASAHLSGHALADAALKLLVLTVMIVVINGVWLLVGASMSPFLRDRRRARLLNLGLAGALVAATAVTLIE